jgi:hypothetical protein
MPEREWGREPGASAFSPLVDVGVLTFDGVRPRTTARWQAAMARAAHRLQREGAPWRDLRLPIAMALVEIAGTLSDDELARRVEEMVPIELHELGPLFQEHGSTRK